jgi:hypothetical protein
MTATTVSPHLELILQEIQFLSQAEKLMLIAELAQSAQTITTAVDTPPTLPQPYNLRDFLGIAPDLLDGQDAQAWVTALRTTEWERAIPSQSPFAKI